MNLLSNPKSEVKSIVYHFHLHDIGMWVLGYRPVWPFDYQLVAHVRASNLDEVYRLTQHADLSSEDEALVSWTEEAFSHRSTTLVMR